MDTRVYIPWRVETPRNVAASKRLLFYLLVIVLAALDAKFLRKGDGGVEGPWLFLELQCTRSVCKRIRIMVRVGGQ